MVVAGIATLVLFASALLDGFISDASLLGLRIAVAGLGLLSASSTVQPGEASHLRRALGPLLLAVVLPMIWLVVQLLPLPYGGNPVWSSAAGALSPGLLGHITVDLQATTLGVFAVFAAALVVVLVATQTIDRARAEFALVALGVAAILMSTLSQVIQRFGAPVDEVVRAGALDCLAITPLLAIACGDLALERYETRHAGRSRARSIMMAIETACLAVAFCCLLVAGLIGGTGAFVASASGLVVFLSIVASRRFGWGPWLMIAIFLILAFVFAAVETNAFGSAQAAITGAWRPSEIEQRMLRDAPWVGTGGGTAAMLSRLYQTLETPSDYASSSAGLTFTLELGLPAFCILILSFGWLEFNLVRDALRRGRDSVYAILGAAFLPTLLFLVFANPGPLDWDVILLGGGILGLALCQSQSRTVAR